MRVRLYFEGHGTVAGVLELFQALPTTTHMNRPDINFFAGDPEAVVETWQPQVGDRVRVRLSGECQVRMQQFDQDDHYKPIDGTPDGHWPQEDDRTGRIVPIDPTIKVDVVPEGHSYAIRFDVPIPMGDGLYCFTSCFAACELELL